MLLSTNQPYFFPFPGFFHKAALSDIFVILDTVQFPRGTTWLTRNRFKNDQGTLWMTIPVWKKGLGLQKIHEVQICHEGNWAKKHLTSLKSAYAKAPYLEEHIVFLEKIFSTRTERLVDLNVAIIRYILKSLNIDTQVVLLSDLGIEGKGSLLLVDICRRLEVSQFLAQSSAKKYLDVNLFKEAGISLQFFNPPIPVYPQLWGNFIPNLSVFDFILNCGQKACDIMTVSYR